MAKNNGYGPYGVCIIPEGDFKGQSVEQAAIKDYAALYTSFAKLPGHLDEEIGERLDEVVRALNSFIPQVPCARDFCGSEATHFKVAISYGDVKLKGKTIRGPKQILVNPGVVFCDKHSAVAGTSVEGLEVTSYPIRFNSLLEMRHLSKNMRNEVTEVILKCAGLNGMQRTPDNLARFIDNLVLRNELS